MVRSAVFDLPPDLPFQRARMFFGMGERDLRCQAGINQLCIVYRIGSGKDLGGGRNRGGVRHGEKGARKDTALIVLNYLTSYSSSVLVCRSNSGNTPSAICYLVSLSRSCFFLNPRVVFQRPLLGYSAV